MGKELLTGQPEHGVEEKRTISYLCPIAGQTLRAERIRDRRIISTERQVISHDAAPSHGSAE